MLQRILRFPVIYGLLFIPLMLFWVAMMQLHQYDIPDGSGLVVIIPLLCLLPAINFLQFTYLVLLFENPQNLLSSSYFLPSLLEVMIFIALWIGVTKLPKHLVLLGHIAFTLLYFAISTEITCYLWLILAIQWAYTLYDFIFRHFIGKHQNAEVIRHSETEESLSFSALLSRNTYKMLGICFFLPSLLYFIFTKEWIWDRLSQSEVVTIQSTEEEYKVLSWMLQIPKILLAMFFLTSAFRLFWSILSLFFNAEMIGIFSLLW